MSGNETVPDGPPVLVCAVCLYVSETAVPSPALTVINGNAVCEEHVEAADGDGKLWHIVGTMRIRRRESEGWFAEGNRD